MSERERFEAWTIERYHGDRGDVLSKRSDGEYISGPMQFAFDAWQAALADRPAEPVAHALAQWGASWVQRHAQKYNAEITYKQAVDFCAEAGMYQAQVVAVDLPTRAPDEGGHTLQDALDAGYDPAPVARPEPAQPPWTDEAMIRFMYTLHANVAEVDRPMARMDFSDEQWARVKAAFATLAPQEPAQPVALEGWKLVPVEATEQMITNAWSTMRHYSDWRATSSECYQAMLAAAPPSHPAPSEAGAERCPHEFVREGHGGYRWDECRLCGYRK